MNSVVENSNVKVEKKIKMKRSVWDKVTKEKIPFILVDITLKPDDDGVMVKNVEGRVFDWNNMEYDELMEKYNNQRKQNPKKWNTLMINLKKSPYMIADCDNEDKVREFTEQYGQAWRTKSSRKLLPHVWFRKHPDDKNGTKLSITEHVDLLYEFVYENVKSEFSFCKDEMRTFDNFPAVSETPTPTSTPTPRTRTPSSRTTSPSNNTTIDTTISNEEKEILDNIDVRYINNYGDWLKIIWGIFNTYQDYNLCDYISQKGDRYKGMEDVKKYVDNDRKQNITWGSVCYYSRISNEENYMIIKNKYNNLFGFDASDRSFADLYIKLFGDDIKKNGGKLFFFKDPFWCPCDLSELANNVGKKIIEFIKFQIQRTEEDQIEKLSQLNALKKTIGSFSKMKSTAELIRNEIEDSDIIFDNKANFFCYTNCAIDLDTGNKITISREDYISISTGYEYHESTQEQQKLLDEILSKIFPDADEKQSFYTLLKVSLYGKQDKKFHVFRGDGNNGKGLIIEHFERVMGNYFGKLSKNFLTKDVMNGGVNEELCYMDRKRIVNFPELAREDIIRCDVLKTITDMPTIEARGCYEKVRRIQMHNSNWVDTNPEINISGTIDESIRRRLVYWLFKSTFTEDKKLLDRHLDFVYPIEPKYKDATFIIDHRSAWVDLILSKAPTNKLILCDSITERTDKALSSMDDIYQFIEPRYQRTGDSKDKIQGKDMYDEFIQTDEYNLLEKAEKKMWSKKKFIDTLSKNINFKGDFKERVKQNGATMRSVFINWCKK